MKGFVYITTNNINGKQYIGKKYYFYKNDKQSNWKTYLGSSKLLLADIAKYGIENFSRTILEEAETEEELAVLEKTYIDSYDAVNNKMFYNLSNNVDKFFTTPDSISKGLLTRQKWSDEKKQLVAVKLQQRWANMDDNLKAERNKKISEAHKNNNSFKKMRSKVQKNVWSNYTKEQKYDILEKRSIKLKQRWSCLSEYEKQQHILARKHALAKMNETIRQKGEKNRSKWNNTYVVFYNIKTHDHYTKSIKEIVEEFKIPFNVLVTMLKAELKITNKGYGTYNTYNRTWKIKPL